MQRLACGLLLAVCAGLGSTAVHGRARVPSVAPPGGAAAGAVEAGAESVGVPSGPTRSTRRVWVDDHVLVAVADAAALYDLAREHGARVVRPPGPAGYAALSVPSGTDARGFARALRADARVLDAARNAFTYGAGAGRPAAKPGRARWHMVASNPPVDGDARGVTIALLDTGVAYENRSEGTSTWRLAPSLAGVRFVAPWDFINADAHPNDDHQHGTHLASLVAAGAPYPGIAPGATIMPVKVLDGENVGTELALVDGIVHAVRNGADVINMSLSFGRGYVPSKALVDALEGAAAAGVVLVAAAGNDGGDYVSQPAANPLVIAVGANRPEGVDVYGAAPYSNASPRVDLVAPGGSVDRDRDRDGLLDGVIGETIALQDPSRTGYWLYAGTSQATALVSGAAARLLADGHAPEAVPGILQRSATMESYIHAPWLDGHGRGRLDVAAALTLGRSGSAPVPRDISVGLLGWLAPDDDGGVRPGARVTVLDERMVPIPAAQVVGAFAGGTDVAFTCVTDAHGVCVAMGPSAPAASGPSWTITADDVVLDGVSHHPRTALFVNEGAQALVAALAARPGLDGAVPAWRWRAQRHPVLGVVADGIVVGNHGRALATSPQVLVATLGVLGLVEELESGTLAIDGGAPASARLSVHAHAAPRCDAGPLAYQVVRFVSADVTAVLLDATGLAETPLAVGALELLGGSGPFASPLTATPVPLSRAAGCGDGDFSTTPVGAILSRGGWTSHAGEPAASALAATAGSGAAHARLAGSAGRK